VIITAAGDCVTDADAAFVNELPTVAQDGI
jgi:hypothetical protein